VRGAILGSAVGLELHDPPDAPARRIVANEEAAEQAPSRYEGRLGELRALDDQDG
jgi:hypothetical protein